ncbi:catechol 2,3-dioxygenase-like lactoylglutathione lyase family enzyme [Caulobacter ginsengisoli]|uniref:Catechol 2,3-dioxygenase-like lactoylglutathione lyase family enzyme n=1 Tax=Caulobacter ginsengisoli TaxID=400775 RepID=A0ABU0IWC2_9CAUL|nr:VOC family protein [Caulobacter ginsengisoli]MDQ0465646.1 catechol 2,3-dioxygenase-like lactoylglutathione lyase family enzyme [Caulobacter ginsengisoli]
MIDGLDHIAIAVRDLDATVASYEKLTGHSADWRAGFPGARHAYIQLGNTALDIVSPTGEGPSGDVLRARLDSHGEGIWGLALAVSDMAKVRHRLERVSLRSSEPGPMTGLAEDGATRTWLTSVLHPKATHGTNLFLVDVPKAGPPWAPSPLAADPAAAVSGLDHVVVRTPDPERAAALYGARLGLDMRLDRSNPDWGSRLMFFRLGDLVVEVAHDLKAGVSAGPDSPWGLSWRVPDPDAARARLAAEGFDVSEVRTGRKPGTRVFTVRDAPNGLPTLMLGLEKTP